MEQYNYAIEHLIQMYEERKARQKEQFERMQDIERAQYENQQSEIIDSKNELLNQEEQFLNNTFFIRLGDFKNELINYYGIDESDIRVLVLPFDSIEGKYSTEERIQMVESNPKYTHIINANVQIPKLNIIYDFNYNMNYNMPQADGRSFIDHCYSYNSFDELDGNGWFSSLRILPINFDEILIKIPYKLLVFEATKDCNCEVKGKEEHEYYFNTPLDVFTTCITNCINKEKKKTLTKKK